jgi:hypothetical protein
VSKPHAQPETLQVLVGSASKNTHAPAARSMNVFVRMPFTSYILKSHYVKSIGYGVAI